MKKRNLGRETWHRLRDWDTDARASQRLACQLLSSTGYEKVDLIHPGGGPDGKKDLVCYKNGLKFIAAVYFPKGQKPFSKTTKKFKEDYEGVPKNKAKGFAFITNQELKLSERETLEGLVDEKIEIEIFHLEYISSLLDQPKNYGIRLEFLDIEMSKEEQVYLFASHTAQLNDVRTMLTGLNTNTTKSKPEEIPVVTPQYINSPDTFGLFNKKPHTCSSCKNTYIVEDTFATNFISGAMFEAKIITCPHCGHHEQIR